MAFPHPSYPGLVVYDGTKGERATPGAFYIPASGVGLLKVAGQAWGTAYSKLTYARRINANPWNKANLVYRASDSNCKAKIVPSEGAESAVFGKGPWIAMGCPAQPVWVPRFDFYNEVPNPAKSGPPTITTPPGGLSAGTPHDTVSPGFGSGTGTSTGRGDGMSSGGTGSGGGFFSVEDSGVNEAGMVPRGKTLLIGAAILAAIGLGVWAYKKKKGK